MATTTNYGWTTPDDTALVKDGAAAIRTLGSSVDTTTKNLNPSTTLGDIEYRSSTANTNTRLGIGSTGNVLTVAGGVPTWAAPAGGGKVLQVVQASITTATTVLTQTFTDTALTASITPTLATSKILIMVAQNSFLARDVSQCGMSLRILRGSTSIFSQDDNGGGTGSSYIQGFSSPRTVQITPMIYLDSPSTTSSTTYKTQGKLGGSTSGYEVTYQRESVPSTITLMEIGV